MDRLNRLEEQFPIIAIAIVLAAIAFLAFFGSIIADDEKLLFTTQHDSLTAEMYESHLLVRENGHLVFKWWLASPGGDANYLAESAEESFILTHTIDSWQVSWLEVRHEELLRVTLTFDAETKEVTNVSLEPSE